VIMLKWLCTPYTVLWMIGKYGRRLQTKLFLYMNGVLTTPYEIRNIPICPGVLCFKRQER
jgi:hypothetical protein